MTPSVDSSQGLLDTNILILRHLIDPTELPSETAISSITLAELSAGVHLVDDDEERASRTDLLQRAEHDYDPIPFDAEAARIFGRISGIVRARGRSTRRRKVDLMIASVAAACGLPLYTTNPDDFVGVDGVVTIVPVRRPADAAGGLGGG